MKSYKHLYEKLIDIDNIIKAIHNASKRKKRRREVQEIIDNPWHHANQIIAMLERGEYTPQKHILRKITDKSSGKERYIMKPYFFRNMEGKEVYEQVIQHAVIQVLRPIIMKGMYCHSYGSIPGRGCHSGKRALAGYIKNRKDTKDIKYGLKCDIHHFYQSINITLLKELLTKKIHDARFLKIIFVILDSNVGLMKGKEIEMGLPIGFYSSQWLANFFLQNFDHYMKEKLKVKFYIRYMDDFVVLDSNKRKLHYVLSEIKSYLSNIKLHLKGNYQLFLFDYVRKDNHVVGRPINFMGFKFYRTRTTLRKPILKRARRAAKQIDKAVKENRLNWYCCSRIMSYKGWFKYTDTKQYVRKYIKPYMHEFRCRKVLREHGKYLQKIINKRENERRNNNADIDLEQFTKFNKTQKA